MHRPESYCRRCSSTASFRVQHRLERVKIIATHNVTQSPRSKSTTNVEENTCSPLFADDTSTKVRSPTSSSYFSTATFCLYTLLRSHQGRCETTRILYRVFKKKKDACLWEKDSVSLQNFIKIRRMLLAIDPYRFIG